MLAGTPTQLGRLGRRLWSLLGRLGGFGFRGFDAWRGRLGTLGRHCQSVREKGMSTHLGAVAAKREMATSLKQVNSAQLFP